MADIHHTPEGWRRDKQPGHSRRAHWMDSQDPSILLLTMVVSGRKPLFGELQGEQISLTPLGDKVAKEIQLIPTYHDASAIEIRNYVVMPDHVHILLQIHERLPKHIGKYIAWFKLQCDDRYQELQRVTTDRLVLADDPASKNTPLFAPAYHDRILTHAGQLEHMAAYIKDNPRRLALKRANPELFRIRQEQRFGAIVCSALGNIFLAEHPQREVLQCSRKMTQAEIDAKREECLRAAANGTVYVSAAISEGEKQISRALREAGYEMIILLTEGFPAADSPHYKYFKPQGVYFETCAAGKLLLIEPAAEMFERAETEAAVYAKTGIHDLPHTTQRYRFLALNAMAEELCRLTER